MMCVALFISVNLTRSISLPPPGIYSLNISLVFCFLREVEDFQLIF